MGKYDNVTTLIAIVVDNEPCFGVICKPFGQRHTEKTPQHNRNSSLSTSLEAAHITNRPYQQEDKQNESLKCYDSSKILNGCFAIYGGTLLGNCYVTGGDKIIRPKKNPTIPRAVISKSRSVGIVRQTIDVLHSQDMLSDNPIYVSGAGEKALRLLIGTEEEALWAFPRPGTSLWDVAAADAMLLACGGMLTDGKGKRIDYLLRGNGCDNKDATGGNQNGESNIIKLLGEKKSKESNLISYSNEEGIVAAISLELHEAAIRVIHDLEGHVNQNSVEDDGVGIK